MYNATIFCNTGFNAVNIPDSPATLNLAQAQYTVPALDIYQARELSQFVVRANYGVVKSADYLYLVNSEDSMDFAYYSIQNVTMTSKDTAVLDVTMDYILTAGGVSNLTFLDGMCERHHVAVADDKFGAFDEEDPYLTPAEMLRIETDDGLINKFAKDSDDNDLSKDDVVIAETTVDLFGMYLDKKEDAFKGVDYTSSLGGVTVPSIRPCTYFDAYGAIVQGSYTRAVMGCDDVVPDYHNFQTDMPNVRLFIMNQVISPNPNDPVWPALDVGLAGWSSLGLTAIRELSAESCIIAQYAIPYFMMADTDQAAWIGNGGSVSGVRTANCGYISEIKGRGKITDVDLDFEHSYSHNVLNKRLFYGENCKYTIVSLASGNQASFLPEEIAEYNSNDELVTAPHIEMRVDPRPSGSPYFRFLSYRGVKTTDSGKRSTFFINSVKGLQWQNVPIVYYGASGSTLNKYAFDAKMAVMSENNRYNLDQGYLRATELDAGALTGYVTGGLELVGGLGMTLNGMPHGASLIGSGAGTLADTFINTSFGRRQNEMSISHEMTSYNIAKNSELQSLLIKNNVVAPSMNFPISEGIRDYVGNTCLVYRTYYTESDVTRLDKILTMYGYKHTTPITNALLTNRPKFNYIQARGVSIGNINLPKWIRDGVASQFATGTRIWHQLPDVSAYTDGSNT